MEKARFQYRNTSIVIHEGDISRVPVDAMLTAINSGGAWFGGIDGVIQRNAGQMFHAQANAAMPLRDGQTVVARKRGTHNGTWGDVVFVIDDLKRPLSQIVRAALESANQNGYRTVSLPAIRTGVMLGVVEPNAKAAIDQIGYGLRAFLNENPNTSLREIHFVIYASPEVLRFIASGSIIEG